jgi:putative hydrolase of HD superfamily
LKEIPKQGWVLIGVKNPESVMEHSFQVAIIAWILGREKKVKLNIERILKMALVHDLCELYAGDQTPYDKILPKNKDEWPDLFDKWPRSTKSEKIRNHREKFQKEKASLVKLTTKLPQTIKEEVMSLWQDYEQGRTKEARFVRQVNRIQTLLQALDYGEKQKMQVYNSWWIGSKEKVDDPLLIQFMEELGTRFHPKKAKK